MLQFSTSNLIQILFISYLFLASHCKPIVQNTIETRFLKYIDHIEKSLSIPSSFTPEIYSNAHNFNSSNVVFAAAMGNFMGRDMKKFAATLRKTGFSGDLVLAIDDETSQRVIDIALSLKAIIYKVVPECVGSTPSEKVCGIPGQKESKVSINMLRYFFYQWWASLYSKHSVILITDFRDVIFQSNPFTYMPELWRPPISDLVISLESMPQKVN